MTTAAIAALVALLALSFWRPLRRMRRVLGPAHMVATGHAFLVLGVLLGLPSGATYDSHVVRGLAPIIAFAAGWVGFAAGSRFEWRVLATVPPRAFARALAPAVAAFVAVAAASAAVLVVAGAPRAQAAAGALCLGAVAASAGPMLAAMLRTRGARRSADATAMLRMVEFSAGIADAVVVVAALVAFAVFRPGTADGGEAALVLVLSVTGGAVLGGALWLFLGGRASDDERLLLGLGMLAMVAGLGGWLDVAPAAVAAVAGIVLANLPGERAAVLFAAVRRVERPVVVILMATIGFYIAGPVTWHLVWLIAAMTLVRAGARALAGGGRGRSLAGAPSLATPAGWTLGLTPQGILGLVVALAFFHVWHDDIARTVLAAAAIAGLINELIAPFVLLAVLRRIAPERRSPP